MAVKLGPMWRKLRYKYKISIFNETTYAEIFSMRLSPLRILTVASVLAVILVSLTFLLVAFTGLKEFIPGFSDKNIGRLATENALKLDSLELEIQKRDRFLKSIQMVLNGEDEDDGSLLTDSIRILSDSVSFELSREEMAFRMEMEEQERYNLSLVQPDENSYREYFHFFPPLEGFITQKFDEKIGHYGIDLVAPADTKVTTVLDGVVIFTEWTVKTGYVIQVQHAHNFISVYKHNSVLLKKQGDYVRAGEIIAVVGNTGEESSGPHLHFELWRAGTPLNPENFMTFK